MIDFSLIKGRIQKHRLSSIVSRTLDLLNEVQNKDDFRYPIWLLYALLKWSYLYSTDSIIRTPIKSHEYNQLLSLIRDFESKYVMISFKNHSDVQRTFRIIAYQQFCHQDKFHNSILSRQIVLFLKLSGKVDLNKEFQQLTGITIKSFFEYSYFTFFFLNLDQLDEHQHSFDGYLYDSFFQLFKSKWGSDNLREFLELLTIRGKNDFEKLQRLSNERLQLYESNFFVTKPFLFFKNQYRIPHRSIFVQTLKYFVYNFLKENSQKFPEEFGRRLEKYIELGLIQNNIPYSNETTLQKLTSASKVVDFHVEPDILIEVKAIELHPRTGVIRTKEMLITDFEHSVVKAYGQLLTMAHSLNPLGEWFGIIVTYKQLMLGFGKDAWIEFLKEPTEDFCKKKNIAISVLPPENLFFVTVEDWDYMMQTIQDGKTTLKGILNKAKEVNSTEDVTQKPMLMEQLLTSHFKIENYSLDYIRDQHLDLDIL